MACYDSGDYTCTYDSGGNGSLPGGGDPDYSSLATWEGDTDIDISGYGILTLDCYDSQTHDDECDTFVGASGLDSTHYRRIQSSSSCATPFAGKTSTGAYFESTGVLQGVMKIIEDYFRVQQLSTRFNGTRAGDISTVNIYGDHAVLVHVISRNSHNNHESYDIESEIKLTSGAAGESETLAYACIASDCQDGSGFYTYPYPNGCRMAFICCTAIGNAAYGFENTNGSGTAEVFSCYAGNNTSGDFLETNWNDFSDYNVSGDEISDLGGTSSNYTHNKDYWDGGTDDAMDGDDLLTASVDGGRNPYNDVTGTSDFNNFLRNDTSGDALFKYSIEGNERPNEDTIDATWDVGASEYEAAGGAISILPMINYYKRLLRN